MRLRKTLSLLAVLATVGVLLAAYNKLGPLAQSAPGPLELMVAVAAIASAVLASLALPMMLPARQSRSARRSTPAQLQQARRLLECESLRYIKREVEQRELSESELVNLRWSSRSAGGTPTVHDLVALFCRPDGARLMITGDAGAGKSSLALLLAEKLLELRTYEWPVPVVFDVSSWDPDRGKFEDWLVHRIRQDHRSLDNVTAYGTTAAKQLIVDGKVLPVLDGLDELPPVAEAMVQRYVEQQRRRPVIVTRRSHNGVEREAREADLLVVRVTEVPPGSALAYLAARDPRWAAVLRRYDRGQSLGGVANALRTPLMVFLAREVSRDGGEDPATLTRPKRFRNHRQFEEHLLGELIPAVYTRHHNQVTEASKAAGSLGRRAAKPWPPGRAHDWLRFIATHATNGERRDIEWWRLWSSVPQRNLAFPLAALLLPAVASGVANLVATGNALPHVWSIVIGVNAFAVLKIFPLTSTLEAPIRIQSALDLSFGCGSLAAVTVGYVLARTVGLAAGLAAAPVVLVVVTWAAHLTDIRLRDGQMVIDPVRLLRRLRTTALVGAGCYGAATAVAMSLWLGPGPNIAMFATVASLIPLRMSAWSTFLGARVETAFTRQLPWRLMTFLNDSTTLGILHRTGPTYRFRHDRLRTKLSETGPLQRVRHNPENAPSSA